MLHVSSLGGGVNLQIFYSVLGVTQNRTEGESSIRGLTGKAYVYTLYIHMTTKIRKWGNSLAVRLPKELASGLSLREGGEVLISQEGDALIIRRGKKSKLKLSELLKKVDAKNTHMERDFGRAVGKELW